MVAFKIEWSVEAKLDLSDILEFYINRNGNSIYSKKLFDRVSRSIKLLSKNPYLGKRTEDAHVRALITGDYQIIYEVFDNLVLIIMIWDCKRAPEDKVIDIRKK
jgi:plasmid stabilization system protein ParE